MHARRYPQSGQNAFHPDPGPRRAGREKRLHIEAKMHGRARGGASARPMAIRHADGRNQSPGAEAARLSPPWQVLPGHPSSSARVARCGWRREPLPRPARLPLRRSTDLPFTLTPPLRHSSPVRVFDFRIVVTSFRLVLHQFPSLMHNCLALGLLRTRDQFGSRDCFCRAYQLGEPRTPLRSCAIHQSATALVTSSHSEPGRSGIASRTT